MSSAPGSALILAGAVAKGAYEAGVIGVLAERKVPITRIIATSSGALNAVAYAAGIRAGHEEGAAKMLSSAWLDQGSWYDSLHFTPAALLTGKGFSDNRGLLKMLHALVTPCTGPIRNEIDLRIVVAPLHGIVGAIGEIPATTYEAVLRFSGEDFDSPEGLERVFNATAAACAFPGLFAAVEIAGLGPCVDGGAVNNTPIRYALEDPSIDHVIVPVPFPAILPTPGTLRGAALAEHLLEALINERLYRDLKDADATNRWIAALDALEASGALSSQQIEKIKSILPERQVRITEIRPEKMLDGNLFSGFLSRDLREKYLEDGRNAALLTSVF